MPDEDLTRRTVPASTPTLRELALVLFRRRGVFFCAAGLAMAAVLLYVFAGPRYQAEMKVMVRPGRADAPLSTGENAPLDLTRVTMTDEELNSEVELIKDSEVLRNAVEENGVGGRDWLHFLRMREGNAQRVERAVRQLGRKLHVEPVKKSNLITISYASGDPQQAARILQSVAHAYLAKHTALHRPGGEFIFFERLTQDARQQLDEAERKLEQFTASHGVASAPRERDLALQRLSEMDASYRQTKIDLTETRQRVSELESQLTKQPERTTTQVRIADNPELMRALKANLLDLQLKRTQLLTKFEPVHPLVKEIEQQIAQAQAAIAAENLAPLRDETTDKNVHYEWAKSELQRAQVQLKALQARETATAVQETAYRATALQLGEDAVAQDDLLNSEKAAQEAYLLYVKKEEQARMADALDERGIANVAIAEQPVAPALPQWSTLTLLAVGLVAAGTAGTGAAFAAHYVDPTFRNPDEVLLYLNAPVLVSLPRTGRGRISA